MTGSCPQGVRILRKEKAGGWGARTYLFIGNASSPLPPPWDIEEHNRSYFIVRDNWNAPVTVDSLQLTELTALPALSEDESHGQAPHP